MTSPTISDLRQRVLELLARDPRKRINFRYQRTIIDDSVFRIVYGAVTPYQSAPGRGIGRCADIEIEIRADLRPDVEAEYRPDPDCLVC